MVFIIGGDRLFSTLYISVANFCRFLSWIVKDVSLRNISLKESRESLYTKRRPLSCILLIRLFKALLWNIHTSSTMKITNPNVPIENIDCDLAFEGNWRKSEHVSLNVCLVENKKCAYGWRTNARTTLSYCLTPKSIINNYQSYTRYTLIIGKNILSYAQSTIMIMFYIRNTLIIASPTRELHL